MYYKLLPIGGGGLGYYTTPTEHIPQNEFAYFLPQNSLFFMRRPHMGFSRGGIEITITILNMIFSVTYYLELRTAISIYCIIPYFTKTCEIGSLDIMEH